jgi:SnoaL-like domain
MTQTPSAAERIEIERACERIVYAYSRALDLGDMSGAADFFAENGSFARPMAPETVIQGREAIRDALLTRPKTLLTKHLATNVMIDVISRDQARGLSYLTMISTTPPGDAVALIGALAEEHQWFRQPGQQFFAETRIDVEERRAGHRVRAILPGVVRAPLHDHISRLQEYLALIENQDEFAFDHDHIVQRPRTMHHGSLATVVERIDVEDPQQMARRGHDGERALVRFPGYAWGEFRNRIPLAPHFMEVGAYA